MVLKYTNSEIIIYEKATGAKLNQSPYQGDETHPGQYKKTANARTTSSKINSIFDKLVQTITTR